MDLTTVTGVIGADRLDGWRDGDAWLAGGTWLFSEPQPGVKRLIDLRALNWPPLTATADSLEISATCTLAELYAYTGPGAELFRQCCDALLGSFKVWNEATVGGNICLGLPAGPMISLATALDATCLTNRRTLAAIDFVTGPGTTVLEPGELLRAVRIPADALRCPHAFRRLSLSAVGRSAAVVIGRLPAGAGEPVITVTAAVNRPRLLGQIIDADWYEDVHGDAPWREHVTRVLADEVRAELMTR